MGAHEADNAEAYLEAGATHLIMGLAHPFDLSSVQQLLDVANG